MSELYPSPPKNLLLQRYRAQDIRNVPTPAAVVDLAVVERNCRDMLSVCERFRLGWRAHVKTHKTVELTRLQLGDFNGQGAELYSNSAKIIASTLTEMEFLTPLFHEYKSMNHSINMLYGLPLGPSQVSRLARIAKCLGQDSISVMIDHPEQVKLLSGFKDTSGITPLVYIKVDMGGKRSGVVLGSSTFHTVVKAVLDAHSSGSCRLLGLYSHAGHSYGGDSPTSAMEMLADEFEALHEAAREVLNLSETNINLDLSVGASPTALSLQNLNPAATVQDDSIIKATNRIQSLLKDLRQHGHHAELHAGVYPLLDLQQLAAHSSSRLNWSDLAFTILAEVYSIYTGRNADNNNASEVLIGAGVLALGREPCKAYKGMAKLTPWNRENKPQIPEVDVEHERGWQVARFSQEHGILQWTGEVAEVDELVVGQKVRLWPNHACIAASHFDWFYVVDSRLCGEEDVVLDVWVKARGW